MKSLSAIVVLFTTLASAAPQQTSGGTSSSSSSSSACPPTASIKNGTVEGYHLASYNQDLFLGVPFAQPPLDSLRFRLPQSINTTFTGAYQATEYAPECIGYGGDQIGYPEDEDCLYLNVVRPSGYEGQSLPVGVWIHGGGLVDGGSRDLRYNLSFIVNNGVEIDKPFIGVSIAYRLSAWGFLSSAEVTGTGQTNVGLRDQRLALHWVQENIAAFGGDPTKVTIWGESAGAGSVGWHLTAYNGRDDGLFRAGIMESGNPVNYQTYHTNAFYQPRYDAVVAAVGCENAISTLDCLRAQSFGTLNAVFNTTNATGWQPIVDGDFVARWASQQLADGDFVHVPVIDGANTDEGTAFGPQGVNSTADFEMFLTDTSEGTFIPPSFVPSLLAAYPNTPAYEIPPVAEVGNITYPEPYGPDYRRSAAYYGDVVMIANRRGTCQTWAAAGVPAYCYRFNTIPAGISYLIGVTHFQEVAFVFDNTHGYGYNAEHSSVDPFLDKPQSYFDLAKLMSSSWASFIYDLDPNGFKGRYPTAAPWPMYSVADPQNIVWDANVTGLAYAEPDTFRQAGIQWILDHALVYQR